MRKSVLSVFQTPRSWLKKRGSAYFFKPTSWCFEIGGNTLPSVLGVAYQTIDNSWRKFSKFYDDRPFPSCFECHYENEAKCKVFIIIISFHSYVNKTHFRMKSFALALALS